MPETLGKYRILSELGSGGFATVYRAEDTTLGREVALKVLDPLLLRDAAWVTHFHKEARTVAALDHPRIVTIHEIAEAEGRLFIAMKLIAGPSLDKALAARGPLPWEMTLRLTREIADALGYAHDRGILHRDLKPGNVLLEPRLGALLTDFGFARLVGESSMSLSLSGGLVGTPHYLAPELWHNQPGGPASDLYALGCILYEMVLGRKAFPGDTAPAVMTAHLLQPLDLPDVWPPGTPPGLDAVLRAALAREPEARIARVADFLAALEGLAEARRPSPAVAASPRAVAGLPTVPPAGASSTGAVRDLPEPKKSRAVAGLLTAPLWFWGLLSLLALLLTLGLGALLGSWLTQPAPTPTPTRTLAPTATHTPLPTATATPAPPTATPTATPVPAPQLGDTWTRPADGMTLHYVPAGEFQMGSTDAQIAAVIEDCVAANNDRESCEGWYNREKPMRTVVLDAFWIDRTEVTNAQYQKCVAAGECAASAFANDTKYNGATQPVVGVDWHNAAAYCDWAGAQLPTEAQWEYAARGPEGLKYPWGNQAPTCALVNYDRCVGKTAPVGSYPDGASWVGALDMAGNVWEWVADWFGTYPSERQSNPTGPASGEFKVVRGGSWYSTVRNVRTAYRGWFTPSNRGDSLGFRCVAVRQD